MINKLAQLSDALTSVENGATILVSGFGDAGVPFGLLSALRATGASGLTVVANNAGTGDEGLAALIRDGRVAKLICSYPRSKGSRWFERRYRERGIQLELVPQGTLSERLRAAGAGIAGFYTPTGAATRLGVGKETRSFDGVRCVLESPLQGDIALVGADSGDRWGNLTYHAAARNYGPTMAMAARITVAEVRRVEHEIDPEAVVTPGIFVDRVVIGGIDGEPTI